MTRVRKRFATRPCLPVIHRGAKSRDFVAQDSGVGWGVDVSACQDDTGGKTPKFVFILKQARKAGSAGTFHHIVSVGEERAHRTPDFVFRSFHDAVGSSPNDGERGLVRSTAGDAIGDTGGDFV